MTKCAVTTVTCWAHRKLVYFLLTAFDVLRVIYFPFKPVQEWTGFEDSIWQNRITGESCQILKTGFVFTVSIEPLRQFCLKSQNCLLCVFFFFSHFPNSAYLLYKWLFKVNASSIAVYQLKVKLPAVSHSSTAVNSCFAFSSRKHISDFKLAPCDFSLDPLTAQTNALTNRHSNINCRNYPFKLLIDVFLRPKKSTDLSSVTCKCTNCSNMCCKLRTACRKMVQWLSLTCAPPDSRVERSGMCVRDTDTSSDACVSLRNTSVCIFTFSLRCLLLHV